MHSGNKMVSGVVTQWLFKPQGDTLLARGDNKYDLWDPLMVLLRKIDCVVSEIFTDGAIFHPRGCQQKASWRGRTRDQRQNVEGKC